jgi:hypothetical protein
LRVDCLFGRIFSQAVVTNPAKDRSNDLDWFSLSAYCT